MATRGASSSRVVPTPGHLSESAAVTLRQRFDKAAGVVHGADGFFTGAAELLHFRVGADLEHAKLVPAGELPVSRERTSLLEDFWRR